MWIGGSPNQPKDGIYPLTGVVETDWSPFTFTMNWRFTRPNHWVHFDAGEPICFIFPVQRAVLDDVKPVLAPIDAEPELLDRFQAWSRARDEFTQRMADAPPKVAADKWQKHYYRGVDLSEKEQIDDHRAKLRLRPFDASAMSWPAEALLPATVETAAPRAAQPAAAEAAVSPAPEQGASAQTLLDLRKREWLLETLEWQRGLSPQNSDIERRADLSSDEFLDRYYAANRPVIITGAMSGWPALAKWTPAISQAGGRCEDDRISGRSKQERAI